jgi:uncharacterized membrane protein
MTKLQFLLTLHEKLSGLPQNDVEERINFYTEAIEDRIEEGLSEEDAVAAVGSVDEIAAQIKNDLSPSDTDAIGNEEKPTDAEIPTKRRLKPHEIVLLCLGAPLWIPLLIAALAIELALLISAAAIILSLYISLWAGIISLWAVFGSLIGCALGGVVASIVFACGGNGITALAILGAGIACAGLSVFAFIGCKAATKGAVWLTLLLSRLCGHVVHRKEKSHA